MANTNMDWRDWLCKQVVEADVDLLREMVTTMAEMLMSAEVSAICGADYRERTDERVNSRNGSRQRPWDTRVGTIDLAIPKLKGGELLPFLAARAPAPRRASAHQRRSRLLPGRRLHPQSGQAG